MSLVVRQACAACPLLQGTFGIFPGRCCRAPPVCKGVARRCKGVARRCEAVEGAVLFPSPPRRPRADSSPTCFRPSSDPPPTCFRLSPTRHRPPTDFHPTRGMRPWQISTDLSPTCFRHPPTCFRHPPTFHRPSTDLPPTCFRLGDKRGQARTRGAALPPIAPPSRKGLAWCQALPWGASGPTSGSHISAPPRATGCLQGMHTAAELK